MVIRTDVRIGSNTNNDTYYNRLSVVATHGIWNSIVVVGNSNMSWTRYGLLEPLVRRGSYKITNGNISGELLMYNVYNGHNNFIISFPYIWDSDRRLGLTNRSSLRFGICSR